MNKLTIQDIFKHKAKIIKTEFQGQEIFVKEFTPAIRQEFTDQDNFYAQQKFIIKKCLVNEDGTAFFSESEEKELDSLKAEYIDVLFTAIMKAVTIDDKETAKN